MLLCGFLFVGLKVMQWIGLPSSTFGEKCEAEGYLHSIDVTNQDCILIIQNISFPKILCKPKLRRHFGIKCRCHLTFILVFKMSRDTLDLKLNVK